MNLRSNRPSGTRIDVKRFKSYRMMCVVALIDKMQNYANYSRTQERHSQHCRHPQRHAIGCCLSVEPKRDPRDRDQQNARACFELIKKKW